MTSDLTPHEHLERLVQYENLDTGRAIAILSTAPDPIGSTVKAFLAKKKATPVQCKERLALIVGDGVLAEHPDFIRQFLLTPNLFTFTAEPIIANQEAQIAEEEDRPTEPYSLPPVINPENLRMPLHPLAGATALPSVPPVASPPEEDAPILTPPPAEKTVAAKERKATGSLYGMFIWMALVVVPIVAWRLWPTGSASSTVAATQNVAASVATATHPDARPSHPEPEATLLFGPPPPAEKMVTVAVTQPMPVVTGTAIRPLLSDSKEEDEPEPAPPVTEEEMREASVRVPALVANIERTLHVSGERLNRARNALNQGTAPQDQEAMRIVILDALFQRFPDRYEPSIATRSWSELVQTACRDLRGGNTQITTALHCD